MQHDAAPILTFAGVVVTAVAAIIVGWFANRRGAKLGNDEKAKFEPSESGEHAHTRDVFKAGLREVRDRLDKIDRQVDGIIAGKALERQQDQVLRSSRRVIDGEDTYDQPGTPELDQRPRSPGQGRRHRRPRD